MKNILSKNHGAAPLKQHLVKKIKIKPKNERDIFPHIFIQFK
jgi:hypothetical protein